MEGLTDYLSPIRNTIGVILRPEEDGNVSVRPVTAEEFYRDDIHGDRE